MTISSWMRTERGLLKYFSTHHERQSPRNLIDSSPHPHLAIVLAPPRRQLWVVNFPNNPALADKVCIWPLKSLYESCFSRRPCKWENTKASLEGDKRLFKACNCLTAHNLPLTYAIGITKVLSQNWIVLALSIDTNTPHSWNVKSHHRRASGPVTAACRSRHLKHVNIAHQKHKSKQVSNFNSDLIFKRSCGYSGVASNGASPSNLRAPSNADLIL